MVGGPRFTTAGDTDYVEAYRGEARMIRGRPPVSESVPEARAASLPRLATVSLSCEEEYTPEQQNQIRIARMMARPMGLHVLGHMAYHCTCSIKCFIYKHF